MTNIASASDQPDPDAVALAQRLRDEREHLGLSQAEVAAVLDIPRAAVSALEIGRRRVTSIELKKLASLYGASVDRLLGGEVEEDATTVALFRTAKSLAPEDREQVLRFAEFLRGAGPAPTVNFDDE